tara:strand:+ start:279694 stop:279807 length:114 start_codon:yes stop_codon:yes gene_type:complete
MDDQSQIYRGAGKESDLTGDKQNAHRMGNAVRKTGNC